MGVKTRIAIGGCSGSTLGMLAGAVAGFSTAYEFLALPQWRPLELFTGLLFLLLYALAIGVWLAGAVIGGVIGSMVGAAVGSMLAAKPANEPAPKTPIDDL